jgi:outer membrane receptor protein involved in Fe transport
MNNLSSAISLALIGCSYSAGAAAAPDPATDPEVEVFGTLPLPGGEASSDSIPSPVQSASGDELERSHTLTVGEYMNRRMGSVYSNDVQNNPMQPDLNYRGFIASPLLGTPQGLAVFMDGVRMNQPFGDVVSWDIIPRGAIESITLVPGSSPVFGLNALGGAISIRTKSGLTHPTANLQGFYGSDKRRTLGYEFGGSSTSGFHWYTTVNSFREDGWRDDSPSKSDQGFAKFGWHNVRTRVSLTVAEAESELHGNGMQEFRLLAKDYSSVYTKPDITENDSSMAAIEVVHQASSNVSVAGNLFYRDLETSTFNGDINEGSLDQTVYQPTLDERNALAAAGYAGFPLAGESAANTPFPRWRCIANILLNEEPNEQCNGLINRTGSEQEVFGASFQISFKGSLAGRDNQLSLGALIEGSRSEFEQSSQFGYLLPDRSVGIADGPGAFADGSQNSEDADDASVELTGHTRTWAFYASDTWQFGDRWFLTISGRYSRTNIETHDLLTPSGAGSLAGDHTFSRFNPALGVTFTPHEKLNLYASAGQSSRAPSAIELGCADPENPCKLPNALAGDPPLDQVVSTTFEAGARSPTGSKYNWHVGVFRTENRDDILFVADDQSGFGYFENFGETLRQGIELGFDARFGALSVGADFTYLDATYQSEEEIGGTGNSTNDMALSGTRGFEGTIEIEEGDRIPLIPRQTLKVFVEYEFSEKLAASIDMLAVSSTFARGNENNLHQPDGVHYLGVGETPGYAVFNMSAEYRPIDSLTAFVQITNLFDREYYTGAQIGSTGIQADGSFIARPFTAPVIDGERPLVQSTFFSPGAPRAYLAGLKFRF